MERPQDKSAGRGERPRARGPRRAGDLLPGALRAMGVPSARLTRRVHAAWEAVCEEAWRDHTELKRIVGGVLDVGVRSSSLRDELTHYHRERLLSVLRTALPDVALVGMRFSSAASSAGAADGEAR